MKPFGRFAPPHRRGFTLIELILVLSVGSMITLLSFQGMKRTTESTQAQIVGQQMKIVGTAVNNYISARYSQISQLTTVPDNVGNTADPGPRTCNAGTSSCVITIKTLLNEGLLPSNYSNNNSFSPTGGNAYTIVLKVTGTSPNWQVNGLVTTVPWTVGGVVRYDLLGQAMSAAGPDSGMTRASSSQIDGYNGIWNEATSTYSNINQFGQLGFRAGYGSALYSVYLRRDGTLPMTGDLNMSDGTPHNIAGAGNISGNGRLTMNQVYSSYVNLAGNLDMAGTATINGSANISGNASVSGGVYTNGFTDYGSATINGNANVGGTATAGRVVVPGGNNVQVGNTYYYGDTVNSAIRQGGTLFVQNQTGSAPAPINVDSMTANGSAYVGNGLTVVNGQNLASGNLTMGNGAEIYNPGTAYYEAAGNLYLKPWTGNQTIVGGGGGSGQLVVTGRQYNNEYIQLNGYAPVGGGCSPNGLIGNDGTEPVFCSNGVWKAATSGQNNYTSIDIGNGGVFGVPSGTTRVDGYVQVTWTGSNAGVAQFIVRDTAGNIQNYFYGGLYGWNDGGSGSQWWFPVSIPTVGNTGSIQIVQINGSNSMTWHISSYAH